ncbi:MAG TPA: NAD-dependent epimerase/dehydratase family protein [Candidatus Limnocylindrales bacterium]|nr:NAD-dependent epimerase/dehydratase family protein [Candidatus Limnocylindrales bacterium]
MKCLIAGGAGFVGSHVTARFVQAGHEVTVMDGLLPRTGGRRENLAGLLSDIRFLDMPVEQAPDLAGLVAESDLLVDCMGWTCHRLALQDPLYDMQLNIASHLALVDAIAHSSGKTVISLGSRGQYGNPKVKTITEETPSNPQDIQGSHKQAAESNWQIFSRIKGFAGISLRIGNCFGPRQPVEGEDIGLIGTFIRDLLQGREIELFGAGRRRPVIYAGDVAEAVYLCAQSSFQGFQIFNLAGADVVLEELLELLIREIGQGAYKLREFPPEIKSIDTGNAAFSGDRLETFLGRLPLTPLEAGIKETIDYFRGVL